LCRRIALQWGTREATSRRDGERSSRDPPQLRAIREPHQWVTSGDVVYAVTLVVGGSGREGLEDCLVHLLVGGDVDRP
jgi:hypothetical protein